MSLLDDDYNIDDYLIKSLCVKKVEDKINYVIRAVKYEDREVIDFSHLLENQSEYILGMYWFDGALAISLFHRPDIVGIRHGIYSDLFYLNPDWNMYNILNNW